MGKFAAIGMASGLLALTGAASASAAGPFYVSPTGSGTACTQISRCAIDYIAPLANSGEDILMAPGTYDLTGDLYTSGNLMPESAGARPVLRNSSGYRLVTFTPVLLRDFRFEVSGLGGSTPAINMSQGGTAQRLEVIASGVAGAGAPGVNLAQGATFTDSVVLASGSNATALSAGPPGPTIRNVTAVASGSGSLGFLSNTGYFSSPGTMTVTLQNSIVRAGQRSFELGGDATHAIVVDADHSNYTTPNLTGPADVINDLGGMQSTPPLFASATDLHELTGSPTINAGAAVAGLSATDLDGQPRNQGAAPDIGADEFVPPAPPGGPAAPAKKKCKKPKKRSAAAAKKCKKKRKRK